MITIVVGIVCLGILFVARDRSGSYRSADWFGVLLVVALCLPLPWRRRHPIAVALALAAFLIYCGLSGAVYLITDVSDRDADRQHPVTSRRPLASGALTAGSALAGPPRLTAPMV